MADMADATTTRDGRGERPVVGLLIAAAAVAVVTVGLVLRFGLVSPPELAPVDEATRPVNALAIISYRDAERGQCLDVVDVDGTVREVRCGLDGGPLLGWDERGILMLRYAPFGERIDVIDPATGATVASSAFDPSEASLGRWGSLVRIERSGGVLTVRDDDGRILWEVDAPDNYGITGSARDATTGMVALVDEAGRLLVLPAGADEPRVWVPELGVRYGEIVWQGTPLTAD
jgi:hypothetical protein